MKRRIPEISDRHKICVICEGNEEYSYLERLLQLNVWNLKYDISLRNAEGNGNIPARYQDRYQSGSYELVLVFCDTEKKPYEQYDDIKRKINDFHGVDDAADHVVIFGNPCTMQIIVKHWCDEVLKKPSKSKNAAVIEQYTGIEKYHAGKDQLIELMKHIDCDNYEEMKRRIERTDQNDHILGGSNFIRFISLFESDDPGWIDKINAVLESD